MGKRCVGSHRMFAHAASMIHVYMQQQMHSPSERTLSERSERSFLFAINIHYILITEIRRAELCSLWSTSHAIQRALNRSRLHRCSAFAAAKIFTESSSSRTSHRTILICGVCFVCSVLLALSLSVAAVSRLALRARFMVSTFY